MFRFARRPRASFGGSASLLLLALATLVCSVPAPRAFAQCSTTDIPTCDSACDAWLTVGGSASPGTPAGFRFHAGFECLLSFATCGNGGSAPIPTTITVWDSACTTPLASGGVVCDSLSALDWYAPYTGTFVVQVGTPGAFPGGFTLAYRCSCQPHALGHVVGGQSYQDYPTHFDATASFSEHGDITDFQWDFGDGNVGGGPTPTHTYLQQGQYAVQLDVTDICGTTVTTYLDATVRDCDANPNGPLRAIRTPVETHALAARPPRRFGADLRTTLEPGTEVIGAQSMAADTAGDVHLVYGADRFPPYPLPAEASIYHRRWVAATETWTAADRAAFLPAGTNVRAVGCAADSIGQLHVVWSQRDALDQTLIYYVARSAAGAWGSPHLLRTVPDYVSSEPVIGADAAGNVYAAWGEGSLGESNVFYTVRRGSTGQWLPSPVALTNQIDHHVADVTIAIEDDLSPGLHIAHFGWVRLGGPGDAVMHRMVTLRQSNGQMHVQPVPDEIGAFSPCGLEMAASGNGLHLMFSTCFIGAAERTNAGGGTLHFVGTTTPGPPNGWPGFALDPADRPTELKRGLVSSLVPDRFGNLHAIVGDYTGLTWHTEWSVKDSLWWEGDVVREVAADFDLTSALAVDRDLRVHAAWMDHRAPDSPCSGEIYSDFGVCTTPQRPDSVWVKNPGTGHALQLGWDLGPDSTASACRYVVYRKLARDAVWDSVADVAQSPWLDRGHLVRGLSYEYRLRPYNYCGESGDTTDSAVGIPRFPLLLVHGCCLGGLETFEAMEGYLRAMGPESYAPGEVRRVKYNQWGHLFDGADSLAQYVDETLVPEYLGEFGVIVDTVDVVAHSMGGIVSRIYAQAYHRAIGTLITLGSPHAGTNWTILAGSQLLSLWFRRGQLALPLRDLSYANMLLVNAILNDTPITGSAWTQCTPPRYVLGAGVPFLNGPLVRGPNDGLVPLASAWFPVGCDRMLFPLTHIQLNDDLTMVAPWVKARLLEDSLHFGFETFALASNEPPATVGSLEDSVAMLPVVYANAHPLHATEAVSDTIVLDPAASATFASFHFEGASTLTLRSPSGQVVDPAYAALDTSIDYVDLPDLDGRWKMYVVRNPEPGVWTTTITATTLAIPEEAFLAACFAESPVRADLQLPAGVLPGGASLPLVMRVRSDAAPVTGATVTATLIAPDTTATTVTLFDDGAHGDGAAGDGAYGSVPVTLVQQGDYFVRAAALGTAPVTGAFERRAHGLLFVGDHLPPGIHLHTPDGGESYERNSSQQIRWDATDDLGVDSVRVELSLDDGATFARLGAAAGTDTSFAWTTPDTTTTFARVRVTAFDGANQMGSDVSRSPFAIANVTGAPDRSALPARATLSGAFPNPFRTGTRMFFDLPVRAHVRLRVYDVAGRVVNSLVDEERAAGRHVVGWSGETATGRASGAGVYFVELEVGEARVARKVLIVR